MPVKNPRVSFVIPDYLKRVLETLAEQEHRSVSNYILKLIIQDIEAKIQKRENILNLTQDHR